MYNNNCIILEGAEGICVCELRSFRLLGIEHWRSRPRDTVQLFVHLFAATVAENQSETRIHSTSYMIGFYQRLLQIRFVDMNFHT